MRLFEVKTLKLNNFGLILFNYKAYNFFKLSKIFAICDCCYISLYFI